MQLLYGKRNGAVCELSLSSACIGGMQLPRERRGPRKIVGFAVIKKSELQNMEGFVGEMSEMFWQLQRRNSCSDA